MDGRGRASALEEGYQMVPFSLKVHTKFGLCSNCSQKQMSARLLMLTKNFCNCLYAWIFVKILCCVAKAFCVLETKIDVGNNVSYMAKLGNIEKTCTIPTINVSGNVLPCFVAVLLKLISQSSVPGSRVQMQAIFDPLGYM